MRPILHLEFVLDHSSEQVVGLLAALRSWVGYVSHWHSSYISFPAVIVLDEGVHDRVVLRLVLCGFDDLKFNLASDIPLQSSCL